jgi:hypothetical protein
MRGRTTLLFALAAACGPSRCPPLSEACLTPPQAKAVPRMKTVAA